MTHRLVLTFALLFCLTGTAAAQTATPPAPALKTNVTITADVVRIGDLVANAGPVADIAIFRAPDLGTTGAVATDRIVDAIRPHQLIGIDTKGITEVTVTRASRAISTQEISSGVAAALTGRYGFGEAKNLQVNFDHDVRILQVEPNVTGPLQVASFAFDQRSARFDITFTLSGSAEMRRLSARYTGTVTETIDAVGIDHPIERGQVIKASDLTVLHRPKTETAALTDSSAVAGMAARHSLRPGQALAAADLMKPEVVQRGDSVTIIYQVPGVTLTLRGQAQDAGAIGDTINVLNAESKRVVQATVSGPNRVTVGAIAPRTVASGGQTASAQ
ncbi:MAG TPA: flagellar basal body P-ring formation chaperone FlgA [Xanthobacteraceae bacterium]|jgi:flagella basal body P-ring formation protein FlgA|nr:flagellar basal body P-ring formation chaperone FlgA [Xanthobacteraceae bacterium]